jgi:hypothetical protein
MGCEALKLGENGFLLYLCSEGAMWDDPTSPGLTAYLNAVAEQQWREQEKQLDLARERELCPPVEEVELDVVPFELVLEWDAYEGVSKWI